MRLRPWDTESSPSVVIPLCMPALSLGSWRRSNGKEGIRPSRLPKDFQIMQEDLRQFVLRRFIEEKKRIQKQLRQDSEDRQRIDLEKATLEGITLDDPTINEVPAIDDMQTVESDSPSFAQISSLAPEGRIFGAGS